MITLFIIFLSIVYIAFAILSYFIFRMLFRMWEHNSHMTHDENIACAIIWPLAYMGMGVYYLFKWFRNLRWVVVGCKLADDLGDKLKNKERNKL